jgi:hypothetical protein
MVLDSSNNPHISYYDSKFSDLKNTHYVGAGGNCGPGNAWTCSVVDAVEAGPYSSIALDNTGKPRIAYYKNSSDDLNVAFWTGSTWVMRIVDSSGNQGLFPSLVIDSSNYAHVSYYDATNKRLKYAVGTPDGSSWDLMIADLYGETGQYSSLALDSAGRPHIAYYADDGDNLKYTILDGSWQDTVIDSVDAVGLYPSIALDSAGRPYISYYDVTRRSLKFAYWTGSNWNIQVADALGDVGLYSSLVINASDLPMISYYDATNGDLKFADSSPAQLNFLPIIIH